MKISNPLTIIAIFAGLAETLAVGALLSLPQELQKIFLYFVMAFPSLIVLLFFMVLYLKNNVLYAPGDFQNPEHYLKINNKEIRQALDAELSKNGPDLKNKYIPASKMAGQENEESEVVKKSVDIATEVVKDLLTPALELLVLLLLQKPGQARGEIINSIKNNSLKGMLTSILRNIKTQVGEDAYNKPMQPTAKE